MKLSQLKGRAVVGLDGAEKLGSIDDALLNHDDQRVVGLQVNMTGLFSGHKLLAWGDIQSIGPDAVTIQNASTLKTGSDAPQLKEGPRSGDVIGSRVLTAGGKVVGTVGDFDIDSQSGKLTGYILAEGLLDRLQRHEHVILPSAVQRIGPKIIVVSDDAAHGSP